MNIWAILLIAYALLDVIGYVYIRHNYVLTRLDAKLQREIQTEIGRR